MAINFDQFFETLKAGVIDIAKAEAALRQRGQWCKYPCEKFHK